MERKVLLVGELNPYGADPRYALYPEPENSAGGRLCRKVLELTPKEYLKRYERANLCTESWSLRAARQHLRHLLEPGHGFGVVVLLGRKVAAASTSPPMPVQPPWVASAVISWITGDRYTQVTLPHPSGRCREWNAPGAYERARVLLREAGAL